MGKILEVNMVDEEVLRKAYSWMEKERAEKNAEILSASYATISDYYVPFDYHISFFYDVDNEKLYARTFIYASGVVTYEEITEPEKLVNESAESKAIAWMLLRTGVYLSK